MDKIVPASFKACSHCHSRKVKCDGALPQCGRCNDSQHECDITTRVFYSYGDVKDLVDEIRVLETRVDVLQSRRRPSTEFDDAHRFDVNVQLQQSGLAWENEQQDAHPMNRVSQELGALSLGHADAMAQLYVGNAAGSRFAKILFNSLDLDRSHPIWMSSFRASPQSCLPEFDQSCASLPSKRTADFAMTTYVKRIHIWWPVLSYPLLRSTYSSVYASPSSCSQYQRFMVFLTLAIGIKECQDIEVKSGSLFTAEQYFRTALKLYAPFSGLEKLTALILLILWSMRSPFTSDHLNIWQLVRHTMSLAIEMGLHRNGLTWGLTPAEAEARNRCWWCIYGLERKVAVGLGRTLSIRNQAIDAVFPKHVAEDDVLPSSGFQDSLLKTHGVSSAVHLIKLWAISGDILESVYIARPATSLSPAILQRLVNSLRQRLTQWRGQLDEHSTLQTSDYLHMKMQHANVVVMLNRPSPSFPAPDRDAVTSCYEAAKSAIETYALLQERNEMFVDWKTFHDVLMTGLVWLYSCWKLSEADLIVVSATSSLCCSVLTHLGEKDPTKSQYVDFFASLAEQVLTKKTQASTHSNTGELASQNLGMDWMNTNFEQSIFDASCTFSLESFDNFMLEYSYLVDEETIVGW